MDFIDGGAVGRIFIQAAAGFAAGLLIVSVLSWYGYPIPEAQAALIVATIPQNCWGCGSFVSSFPGDKSSGSRRPIVFHANRH